MSNAEMIERVRTLDGREVRMVIKGTMGARYGKVAGVHVHDSFQWFRVEDYRADGEYVAARAVVGVGELISIEAL